MCSDCKASAISPAWPQYNSPQCAYCAARLLRDIGKLKTPTAAQITARRRVVLADAIAYGHSEVEIRRLHKVGPWVEPVLVKSGKG